MAIISGKKIKLFSLNSNRPLAEEIASYVGVKNAAALSAGTAALHLAIKLAGVGAVKNVYADGEDIPFEQNRDQITFDNTVIAKKLCVEA